MTNYELSLINKLIQKYLGKKDNPLNGLTFSEILAKAYKELETL